jgi:Cysteine-rich secretory protein family
VANFLRGFVSAAILLLLFASGARTQKNDAERQLFDAVNREREAQSMPVLLWDEALARAARLHARRMADLNLVEHQLPGEADIQRRCADVGARFSAIAENIAVGNNPDTIHNGWMHSIGHKQNILNPLYNAVGIAVVRTNVGMFAVQDFSHAVSSLSLDEQEQKMIGLIGGLGIHGVKATPEARRTCATDSGFAGVAGSSAAVFRFDAVQLDKLPDEVERKMKSLSFSKALVGACGTGNTSGFIHYRFAVVLY